MPFDTQDRATDDRDAALAHPAREQDTQCLRCDQQPGSRYVAEIAARPGRPAERAATMRDTLLGGGSPLLCRGCAEVLATYGHALGWQLRPAGRTTAPPARPGLRAAGGRAA